jgi:DUF4097 and DUF4098 domain-containing protein YvlB
MSAINNAEDKHLKNVLILMVGVFEEIGTKIDNMYKDKESLRESVLNGHADIHHDDHEWIKQHRVIEVNREKLVARALPLMHWVELKVQEEIDTKKDNRSVSNRVRASLLEKIIWMVSGSMVAMIGHQLLMAKGIL